MTPAAFELILAMWLAALGGAIGSFLNVVVYRLPLGMSLSRPGSHCPKCQHPIRWFDNVPVLGWLTLRGRCRDCRAPISPRYPLIEAAVALLFLTVGVVEALSGGANLPSRPVPVPDGLLWPSLSFNQAGTIAAFHLLLLTTLLAAALIEYDRAPVPWRLAAPAVLIGFAAPLAWPWLRPVPAALLAQGWQPALLDTLAGLSAGLALALLTRPLVRPISRTGWTMGLLLIGLFLGWQAALALTLAALILHLLSRAVQKLLPRLIDVPATAWLTLGALAWILAWRQIAGPWPL